MGFLIFAVCLSLAAKYFSKRLEAYWPLVLCAVFWSLLAWVFLTSDIFLLPVAIVAIFWTASQAWQGHKEEGWPWSNPL